MTPSREATEWLSLVRDSDIVGYVRIVGCDNFHIFGRFRAGPAYERYKELLARTHDQEKQGWLDALDAVDGLGLRLVNAKGESVRIRDFQLEALEQRRGASGVPVEFKFI